MPTIHITIDEEKHNDPLDEFDDEPEVQTGCCGSGEKVNADHAAAVSLAKAAKHLRDAIMHVDDEEIDDIVVDVERLAAEYLAGDD